MDKLTKKKEINKDLQNERIQCDFNIEELINILDGGAEYTEYRRKIDSEILNIKGLQDEIPEEYLSHKERYENSIRKAVILAKYLRENKDTIPIAIGSPETMKKYARTMSMGAVFKDNSPFALHSAMFIPAILNLCSDEQKEVWLDKAYNMEIIGTYAQTELGHGTFIRGLELTATYDPKTEEFELNSPSLSSYKWWPGGLGHTANYAIVMAQLYSNGKHCGMQPFMVQLRDTITHMPLPGIKIGEIGAKLGFNTVNNGFLGFDKHRIKREMMLMKNSKILSDGTFVQGINSKMVYGTMVYVRVNIVNMVANFLAKASTIAVRYSAVRRQSKLKPGEPEPLILDYLTQQHKLFISIASSHVFTFTAEWIRNMYLDFLQEAAAGKMDRLPELHASSCCLKVVAAADAAALVERCRLACGGHGYMLSSNLPLTYGLTTAASTYEGEQTVLLLQTARALIKSFEMASKGKKLHNTMAYISEKFPLRRWNNSTDDVIDGFKRIALGKIAASASNINKHISKGLCPEDAWNMTSVQLINAAESHARLILLSTYKSKIAEISKYVTTPLKNVMNNLFELYVYYWALEKVGDLLRFSSISEFDIQEMQQKYEELLIKIRPNAVSLADGFDLRDEILQSTLGAYDGQVYERLMEEAMKSPLNQEPVNESFHKYLKPFMQGKL